MKVAVMTGEKKMKWCEREIPQPGPGELQIRLEYVGACGFDLHFYLEGHPVNWMPDGPLVLGHEPGGVVSAVGKGVTGLEIRGRVALGSRIPRGHHEDYLKGHYNLYRSMRFTAIPDEKDGVSSECCIHAVSMTFRLPDSASTMEGGLMGPLVVGIHAYELSNAKLGGTAAVLGAGCIGLATLMSLKVWGADETYAAGVLDKYLKKARELGAIRVFNSRNENIEEFVKTLPGGGVDQAYEYAGNRITTLQACRLIKRAGEITLMGVSPEPVLELDIVTLNAVEGTVYPVYHYRSLCLSAIGAVSKGFIPFEKIASHTSDSKDVIGGVDYNLNHKGEAIETVIRM